MQKTYKGDERFILNEDFDIKLRRGLPVDMLGAMNKRETDLLQETVARVSVAYMLKDCVAIEKEES